jgi:hypothetical protein
MDCGSPLPLCYRSLLRARTYSTAERTSPEVIDAPPGSLCEIVSESGRWAYVAFASKTRGWVLLESIEKVLPEKNHPA